MIRLINRRLIIPQGDTGSFSIPTQGEVTTGDKAIFSILDTLTNKVVCEKIIEATNDILNFDFTHEDTCDIEPSDKRYVWDVTICRNPIYDEDGTIISAGSIDSYYSAFKLPECHIRKVSHSV